MKKGLLFLVLFSSVFSIYLYGSISQQLGKFKEIKTQSSGYIITAENANIAITAYSEEIVRIRVEKNDFPVDFSYAVIQNPLPLLSKIFETDNQIILATKEISVVINKNPVRLIFLNKDRQIINTDDSNLGVSFTGTEVCCYKKLFSDEKFIGLGEKTGGLNRRGSAYENWNSDVPGYSLGQDPLYATIPFYIGIHDKLVYGIFLDNTYRTFFNFGASTDDKMSSFGAADGELNYYFISGNNVAKIIENYTYLTGRSKLPPLWSLGYQQCRYSYFPDKELLTIAKTFRDKQIPADVIYLDIHYMDSFKVFTFSPEYYPKPAETIDELKKMGFHVVTIVDPGLKIQKGYFAYEEGLKNDYFIKYPNHENYVGSVWPGRSHFPDFTNPTVREWWGSLFKKYTDVGIDGIWNDMNEPAAWGQHIPGIVECNYDGHKTTMLQAHNVYGMQMARSTYEGFRKLHENQRPLNITRATYSGGQRYSTIWTGDNASYDGHMLLGVRLVNSLGLAGFSFAGPDIGGFTGEPSPELMTRWLSIGIYTPFLRNHVAYDRNYREPWVYGKELEKINRELINQRYKLLPYLYSVAYEATQNGLPVNRSLAIKYTFDENIYKSDFENEYLFGPSILVAPAESKQQLIKVYLPAGDWYRLSTGKYYNGNQEIVAEAPLNDLPVFVKSGAIIPMQTVVQNTNEKPDDSIDLHIYWGNDDVDFVYYEDDGISYNFEKNEYYKRIISYHPGKKQIIFSQKTGNYKSKFNNVHLILHHFDGLNSVMINKEKRVVISNNNGTQMVQFNLIDSEITLQY